MGRNLGQLSFSRGRIIESEPGTLSGKFRHCTVERGKLVMEQLEGVAEDKLISDRFMHAFIWLDESSKKAEDHL